MSEILYLVTGARGHVGTALVRELLSRGCRVRGFALPSERDLPNEPDIEMVYGDVRDRQSLLPLFENTKPARVVVIHTAGIVAITSKFNQTIYDVNVLGTQNVISLCVSFAVQKLIYVSSVHAIPELPTGETIREVSSFDPRQVHGLYAKTKAEATQKVLDAAREGLDASVVHPSGILGPYDPGRNHLNQMILDYCDGRLVAGVKGGGYDFVDVRDVANGILSCVTHGRAGECYICSNQYLSVPALLQALHEVTGLPPVRIFFPMFFAKWTAPLAELWYKLKKQPPLFTAYSLYTLTSNANFSHEKAQQELRLQLRPIRQTLQDTFVWLREQGRFRRLDKRLERLAARKKKRVAE